MKLLLSTLVLSIAIGASAGELRSKELRSTVCSEIKSENYFLSGKDCVDGKIKITDTEKFSFKGKSYTVAMTVKASFKGSNFSVTLERGLNINAGAVVTTNTWTAVYNSGTLGNYHIIEKTDQYDKNAKEITSKAQIKKLPEAVREWESYSASDYSANAKYTYFKVYKGRKIIGYIAHAWYESEEDDIKGYDIQKFDRKGNEVGEGDGESFGFHE